MGRYNPWKDAAHYLAIWAVLAFAWVGGMAFWATVFPLAGSLSWAALVANSINSIAVLVITDKLAHALFGLD